MSKHRGKHKPTPPQVQLNTVINALFRPGMKANEPEADAYIRSYTTKEGYATIGKRYLSYCQTEHGCRDFSLSGQYASAFLVHEKAQGKSVSTIKTERSALCKIYGLNSDKLMQEVYSMTDYTKNDFMRSRENLKRSRSWYENRVDYEKPGTLEHDIYRLTISTGLRRDEIQTLCPCHVHFRPDGSYWLDLTASKQSAAKYGGSVVHCKGGRDRIVDITFPEGGEVLKRWMQRSPDPHQPFLGGKGFHRSLDNHAFRAEYANRLYKALVGGRTIPKHDRIYLRKDLAGTVLSRSACKTVSQQLGHNRNVFASNYYRP